AAVLDVEEERSAISTDRVEVSAIESVEMEDAVIDIEEHELDEEDSESDSEVDAADEAHEQAHAMIEAGVEHDAVEMGPDDTRGNVATPDSDADGNSVTSGNPSTQERQPWNARVQGDYRSRMQHPARRGGRDRGGRHDRGRHDRGRRPQHGHGHGHSHGHRTAPRRTQLIADLLKQGQEIIVQIAKEPLGKKGARITSHVALPGRYLVYMPTVDHIGVSRKIGSCEERPRLRRLLREMKGSFPGGFNFSTRARWGA